MPVETRSMRQNRIVLPEEVWRLIVPRLESKTDLLNCRLVSKDVKLAANIALAEKTFKDFTRWGPFINNLEEANLCPRLHVLDPSANIPHTSVLPPKYPEIEVTSLTRNPCFTEALMLIHDALHVAQHTRQRELIMVSQIFQANGQYLKCLALYRVQLLQIELPTLFGHLVNLKSLDITWCRGIERFETEATMEAPNNLSILPKLTHFTCYRSPEWVLKWICRKVCKQLISFSQTSCGVELKGENGQPLVFPECENINLVVPRLGSGLLMDIISSPPQWTLKRLSLATSEKLSLIIRFISKFQETLTELHLRFSFLQLSDVAVIRECVSVFPNLSKLLILMDVDTFFNHLLDLVQRYLLPRFVILKTLQVHVFKTADDNGEVVLKLQRRQRLWKLCPTLQVIETTWTRNDEEVTPLNFISYKRAE